MQVSVRLLGTPSIEQDGHRVAVDTRKAIALLAYLALAGRPVSRDVLAALLWPEADQIRARAALRRTLSTLNAALDGCGLAAEGATLALEPDRIWVDALEFRRLVSEGDVSSLREAVGLYRGDLLEGFGLRDSADFDEWQLAAAETFRREVGSVLHRLIGALGGELDVAISYAVRWLEVDPLEERAHRALIGLHLRKGERAAAVRQYKECVEILERELGVPPGAETTEVYEAARRGEGPDATEPETAKLHELMADLLTLQGRYGEAAGSYETSLELGAPGPTVRRKMADLCQRRGDYEGAESLYQEALGDLPSVDPPERARLLADRSLNTYRRGRYGEARELADLALREAGQAEDDRAAAQAHNILGMLLSHGGDAKGAEGHLRKSLELAEGLSDPVATAAALNNLAHALRGSDVERALKLAERALDLCVRVGDRHREAAMHSNLADLLQEAGREEEARRHLRISAAMFAEVGEPDELRPEIWKLVEW